jgi:S-adenosylmethionine hydrolase
MVAADAAGVDAARELANPAYRLERVSRTFHARDVFAPAAAHLAAGAAFDDLGPPVDPATLVRLAIPRPEIGTNVVRATVLAVDRFGNIQLNLAREDVVAVGIEAGSRVELSLQLDRYYAAVAETFADADAGELLLYEDSYGSYAIAINGGHAAALTGARPGDVIRIAAAPE